MQCPRCRLESPPSALRCDCGYDFSSRSVRSSHLRRAEADRYVPGLLHDPLARRRLREYAAVSLVLTPLTVAWVGYLIVLTVNTAANGLGKGWASLDWAQYGGLVPFLFRLVAVALYFALVLWPYSLVLLAFNVAMFVGLWRGRAAWKQVAMVYHIACVGSLLSLGAVSVAAHLLVVSKKPQQQQVWIPPAPEPLRDGPRWCHRCTAPGRP